VQPDELNLLEDGLQLWLVALRNAIAPDPQLVGLFPNLSLVLDHSTGAELSPCVASSSPYCTPCSPQCPTQWVVEHVHINDEGGFQLPVLLFICWFCGCRPLTSCAPFEGTASASHPRYLILIWCGSSCAVYPHLLSFSPLGIPMGKRLK
jgi:hypothetical protein